MLESCATIREDIVIPILVQRDTEIGLVPWEPGVGIGLAVFSHAQLAIVLCDDRDVLAGGIQVLAVRWHGRSGDAADRDLRIQITVQGGVRLASIGTAIPREGLDDDAAVEGLRHGIDGAPVTEASKPIGGRDHLDHAADEGVSVRDVDGWHVLTVRCIEKSLTEHQVLRSGSRIVEFVSDDGGESFLCNGLHAQRRSLRSGPHSVLVGVADHDGLGPAGRLGKVDGLTPLAPLAAERAVVSQRARVRLLDLAVLEVLDAEGLVPTLPVGFLEARIGNLRHGLLHHDEEGAEHRRHDEHAA